MKYFITSFIFTCSLISIRTAYADVVINEIAWRGYNADANNEWVELYNSGDLISLNDYEIRFWKKTEGVSSAKIISLSGDEIVDYLIICKKDKAVDGGCSEKVSYGSIANDTNFIFALYKNGAELSRFESGDNWSNAEGSKNNNITAQRTNSGKWITAAPTPGKENIQTGSGGNTGGSNNSDDDPDLLDSEDEKFDKEDEIIEVEKNPIYSARMVLPHVFVQHVPVELDTLVMKDKEKTVLRGKYEWSMGDGGYYLQEKSVPFNYVYKEPGEYTISLRYYSSIFNEKPDTIHRKVITVLPVDVSVEHAVTGTIRVINNTSGTLDLGGWKLWRNEKYVTIPLHTLVQSKKVLFIPYHVHNFDPVSGEVFLLTPTNVIVTGTQKKKVVAVKNSGTKKSETVIAELLEKQEMENLYQEKSEVVVQNKGSEKSKNPWVTYSLLFITVFSTGFGVFSYLESRKDEKEKM